MGSADRFDRPLHDIQGVLPDSAVDQQGLLEFPRLLHSSHLRERHFHRSQVGGACKPGASSSSTATRVSSQCHSPSSSGSWPTRSREVSCVSGSAETRHHRLALRRVVSVRTRPRPSRPARRARPTQAPFSSSQPDVLGGQVSRASPTAMLEGLFLFLENGPR